MSIWGKRVDGLFASVSGQVGRTRLAVIVCAVLLIAVALVVQERRTNERDAELACLNQRTEVLRGERLAVDADCR